MADNFERLNDSELDKVSGGRGGSPTRLPDVAGLMVYKIQRGDKLGTIARTYNTTTAYLKSINPTITNVNDITAGYYIYVPF